MTHGATLDEHYAPLCTPDDANNFQNNEAVPALLRCLARELTPQLSCPKALADGSGLPNAVRACASSRKLEQGRQALFLPKSSSVALAQQRLLSLSAPLCVKVGAHKHPLVVPNAITTIRKLHGHQRRSLFTWADLRCVLLKHTETAEGTGSHDVSTTRQNPYTVLNTPDVDAHWVIFKVQRLKKADREQCEHASWNCVQLSARKQACRHPRSLAKLGRLLVLSSKNAKFS